MRWEKYQSNLSPFISLFIHCSFIGYKYKFYLSSSYVILHYIASSITLAMHYFYKKNKPTFTHGVVSKQGEFIATYDLSKSPKQFAEKTTIKCKEDFLVFSMVDKKISFMSILKVIVIIMKHHKHKK